MLRATVDLCVLMGYQGELTAIVILLVDSDINTGTPQFLNEEERASIRCKRKPGRLLTKTPTTFK